MQPDPAVPQATPDRSWACPIPGHSDRRGPNDAPVVTVEWDGDVAYCTAPGCGRSSDNEQGCNCEEYDCDGSCCGGQCSCADAEPEAKLRDEVSDEKCGGDGCPGCTALTADRDRLREDWEYRGHQLDDAATVGRALIDERDRLADTVRRVWAWTADVQPPEGDVTDWQRGYRACSDRVREALDGAHLPEVGEPGSNLGADDPIEFRPMFGKVTEEGARLVARATGGGITSADLPDVFDSIETETGTAAALGEAEAKLRRYEPVIDAAKAWRVAARASEVFRLEASFETATTMADLSTAVDALDASPGDADREVDAGSLSLGEQPHDGTHCHEGGRPHLGPCINRTEAGTETGDADEWPDSDDLTAYLAEQLKDGRFNAAYHAAGDRARIIRTLVATRVKAGLTADQVAKRMQVKPKDVRAYERGAVDPALSFHQRYAAAVGLELRIEIEPARHADG